MQELAEDEDSGPVHFVLFEEQRALERGLRVGKKEGKKEGLVEALLEALTERFGSVPVNFQRKLKAASYNQLKKWICKYHQAPSLNALFARSSSFGG